MNLRILFAFIRSFSTIQQQYKEEAEKFDKENKIDCPISKAMSNSVVLLKIVGFSIVMGDLDFLDEIVGNKWMAILSIIGMGVPILFFISLLSHQEKQDNRNIAMRKIENNLKKESIKKINKRRKFRKDSKYIDDLGF